MSGNISSDAIDQFRSVTNVSFEEAQNFLTLTDNNVEYALLLYFENQIQAPSQSSRQTFPPENNNAIIREETTTTPQITRNATINGISTPHITRNATTNATTNGITTPHITRNATTNATTNATINGITTPQITRNATNARINGTITNIDDDDENDENIITTIDDDEYYENDENDENIITTIDDDEDDENDENITTTITTENMTTDTSSSKPSVNDNVDRMDLDNEDDNEIAKISQIDADEELAKLLHQQEEKAAVRAPIPPRRDILFGNLNGGDSYPNLLTSRRSRDHRTFAGDTRPHNDLFANKPDELVKMFSPPFDIMSTENFEMTRNRAKSSGKWIMINIQSISEFTSQVLNRDLWSNDTVKDIIRAHFCFLQYNSDSTDGSKYINFYPVYKYPHVAVIDPRTGERLKVWDSQLEPTEFIINVTDFLEKYSLDEEPNHSESSTAKKTSDGTSEMSVDDQSNAEPQNSNDTGSDDQNTSLKKEKEVPKVHPVFEEIPYKSIFDSIKPIERPDQTGPKSTSIKFRLEGRHVIKKFNKKDPVRYMFEYLKASVPELNDKFFELNYLRNNLIEKIDETIEEAGLINAAINVVLG